MLETLGADIFAPIEQGTGTLPFILIGIKVEANTPSVLLVASNVTK